MKHFEIQSKTVKYKKRIKLKNDRERLTEVFRWRDNILRFTSRTFQNFPKFSYQFRYVDRIFKNQQHFGCPIKSFSAGFGTSHRECIHSALEELADILSVHKIIQRLFSPLPSSHSLISGFYNISHINKQSWDPVPVHVHLYFVYPEMNHF